MSSQPRPVPAAAGVLAGLLLAACNQSGVQNAAPRLASSIPQQTANGGATFTLDLAEYVTDRETPAAALTYEVVSGGGSFAGSTYQNVFPTLGSYTVVVRITDPAGKSLEADFGVDVKTANLAVTTAGSDLALLDTDTLQTRTFGSSAGFPLTFKDSFERGFIVYERQAGTDYDLYVYDASRTATVALGDDRAVVERYVAKVGSDRLLFSKESASARTLHLYDVRTGETTLVAAADGESAGDALVGATGLVYYELSSQGQNDVYVFDPTTGTSSPVSTDGNAEEVVATLADGALVFSRRGNVGETDLFYWRRDAGLFEIGGDVPAIADQSKEFGGSTKDSLVAFTVNVGGQLDLYVWNPQTGVTTAVATGTDNESFAVALPTGHFLYYVLTGGTDLDLRLFDVAALASRPFPASIVHDMVVGTLSDGRVVVQKAEVTGTHLYLASYASPTVSESAIATTAGQNFALVKVLANDRLVYRNLTTGGITLYAPGTGVVATFDPTSSFVAEMPITGDFVFKVDNGGQFDLTLWDESAATTVPFAVDAADEELAYGLTDGRILFTRETAGGTARELFVWHPDDQSVAQVTDDGVDHVIQTTFAADAR